MHFASLLFALLACSGEEAPPPPVTIATDGGAAETTEAPGDIVAVLEENQGQIETCFKNELRENPKLSGRIEFEWQIDNHRAIGGQVVSSSFPQDADIESLSTCVIEAAKSWRFPAGSGSVRYPITFTPRT